MTKQSTNIAIETKGLYKSYGKLKVLEGVDLKVERGTIMALLGPNGAGKTTTVKILSTLLTPDGGEAKILGNDVVADADAVRSVIGLTGQYAAVDEYLTGKENLKMMGRLYHLSHKDAARRTDELLEQFDLVDAADRPAKTYSGGMRRRLDLAVSLIASAPVIFLDEPTTGLDPRSRLAMWAIIKQLVKGGSTILLTTQYLEEADQLADRIAVIDGGRVIAEGTADELKEKTGKERIELSFKAKEDFLKAKKLVGKSKGAIINEDDLIMSVPNEGGVKRLRALLEQLETAKVVVEGISLHKPTLDDVFLDLTGHGANSSDDEQNDDKGAKHGKN